MATILRNQVGLLAIALMLSISSSVAADDHAENQSSGQTFQAVDVFRLPPGEPLDLTGAAWLKRSKQGFTGRIMTKVDKAGYAYTIWLVIFNNPDACEDGCNDMDLGNPDVKGAVFYGNGAISSYDPVNGGGVINVDFDTIAAKIPEGMFRLDDLLEEPIFYREGLARGNGFGAEVHIVVDEHPGPVETGLESWVPDLTTTNFPEPRPPGTPTLNAVNVAAAMFPPVD